MSPASEPGGRPAPPSGLVIVDKPGGRTSHDVVARIRRLAGTRRVGHAGTLDPMATGVLVVGVGTATRLLHHLVLTDKAYTATIRLGSSTVTDDAEGEVRTVASAAGVRADAVDTAVAQLTGAVMQVPSAVSAIKVDGQRAYKRVRAGDDIQLAARPVRVTRFEVLGRTRPTPDLLDLDVVVECSSGTYVRALARDLGDALGVGGHLTALRRTRVGPFTIAQARTLEELAGLAHPVTLPLADAVRAALPVRVVDEAQARELAYGRSLDPVGLDGTYGALSADTVALALLHESDGRARPVVVFAPAS